eukprot:jgi/Botrbrau1/9294/Bobra.0111s0019.1
MKQGSPVLFVVVLFAFAAATTAQIPACMELGLAIVNQGTACNSEYGRFMNDMTKSQFDSYSGATDEVLMKTFINAYPTPSATCCGSVAKFISKGCACDPAVMAYAQVMYGTTPSEMRLALRIFKLSACGSNVNNPCEVQGV